MWPDGNASLVRLMVARLMPHVAPDVHADNVAVASFDYGALDEAAAAVRLRLNATAVGIENTDAGVTVDYVKEGRLCRVSAQHAVLACYHSIIPHLCPTLDEAQKEALTQAIPAGRLGEGNDIAAACLYLASDEAAYVTGQTLHVNGGMAMI